jgi:hypothetical protein
MPFAVRKDQRKIVARCKVARCHATRLAARSSPESGGAIEWQCDLRGESVRQIVSDVS